ncbi:MAG: hypothetical protein BJ554DRAFT_5988 [Olpidium bornovanus]|uniref:Uncharacterized protein n=1 Tax=Olpidium bornovanus TaxID=278681 RepID=A0A8H7ZYQ7_9FUNG|nr:MAG: hypothetical protein BJ554DRAFT_5988 [Olpidium bornovanus]
MLRGPAATASPPEGMTDDDEEKFLEVNGAWEFMEWLELYHDLFTAPCCGCGRLIKRQGLNAEFILPHVRVFTGLPGYDQKNPRSFGKAWHRSCLS